MTWPRLLTPRIAGLLAVLLSLVPSPSTVAQTTKKAPGTPKGPKPWTTFEHCTYVENPSNDGDSFRVRCGKQSIHVRLYFVDAPESNHTDAPRVTEQSQHFGIAPDETIQAGLRAAAATRAFLSKPFTVHTRWTVAGGRSKQPRYYSFVEVGGRNLADTLVAQGWARAKGAIAPSPTGEPSKSIMARLRSLESQAREKRVGSWTTSTQPPRPRPSPEGLAAPQAPPRRR